MKIFFSITVLTLVFSAGITSMTARAQNVNQAYMVNTFELNSPELIDISTSGGFIQIIGSDRRDVQVEMYVRQRNRYLDESDTDLEEFDIDISQNGAQIKAFAHRESSGWRFWRQNSNISVSFIVRTPIQTNVQARTSGGSMVAENLSGTINLRTSGGQISLERLEGTIDAHTSGGNITIGESRGNIVTRTSGGGITATNSEGNLDLRTSGGSIRLRDLGGSLDARTSGGSISARMIAVTGDINLRTSGGNITIDLPSDEGYDFDLNGNSVRSELSNFSGDVSRDRLTGTVNNGGYQVTARTSGGSVRVNAIQ